MTTKQDTEYNLDDAIDALRVFRVDVDQWLNLITTRRPTGRWSGAYESDEKRDYLGRPERLAESGERLNKELKNLLGKQVINESVLNDIIEYCEMCEGFTQGDSPKPTEFFIPALDILDTELHRLSRPQPCWRNARWFTKYTSGIVYGDLLKQTRTRKNTLKYRLEDGAKEWDYETESVCKEWENARAKIEGRLSEESAKLHKESKIS